MLKNKTTIGRGLLGIIPAVKAAAARSMAAQVKAEFITMLMSAPQYSGNYVANMRISIGDRKSTSEVIRPYKKHPKVLKSAGVMGPITTAMNNSDLNTLEERFAAHVMGGAGLMGANLLVYNNLREAKYIEGMGEDRLRKPNKGGVEAMDKFKQAVRNIHVEIKVT